MAYIVDIIFVAIFALMIYLSSKKGFFKSLIDLAGSMIAVILARIVSGSVASTVFGSFVAPGVQKLLEERMGSFGSFDYTEQIENALQSLPDGLSNLMSYVGFDKQALVDKLASSENAGGTVVEKLMDNIITPVGTAALKFVLFVILAIVFIILIKVLSRFIDKLVKKFPVIKGFNKTFGAIFGIVRGLIIVVIVAMLVSLVVGFTNNKMLISAVEDSIIVNAVKDTVSSLVGFNI